jgi:mRNA deadenylase 3'-5' endonuclease subunit Ccr4
MSVDHELAAHYGTATVAIPIASEFEAANFEKLVSGKTHIRLFAWPKDADGDLTFSFLKSVVCIDMKGLNMTYLSAGIGQCTELECLDVRDNCLQFLPPELSQCSKLKTLLYSGNSLNYRSQMQIIIELRQLNQTTGSAPSFKWTQTNALFTIVSWNILPQTCVTQEYYPKTPCRYLKWVHRAEAFMHVVLSLKPHILCIQDLQQDQLALLTERMRTIGYACLWTATARPPRSGCPNVGVATFYLKSRITIEKTIPVSFSDLPGNEYVTKLQLIANEGCFQMSMVRMQAQSFVVINALLHACRYEPEVLMAQLFTMLDRVDGLSVQAVICGSLGFKPGSRAYQFLSTGEDPEKKYKLKRTYRLAYADGVPLVNVEFTQWDDDGFAIGDYIWISSLMASNGWVETPREEDVQKWHHSCPNSQWPSTHIPLGVALDIKSPQEG